jgi:prepilin-type N-terminal cleavage/methylation domain-containing protein
MRGFSLIETLVAVVILVSVMVGPLTLAQRSMRSAAYARDQVVAGFLAEEAIEYIRAMRDGNKYEGRNWLRSFDDCIGNNMCTVDATQDRNEAIDNCRQTGRAGPLYSSRCDPLRFHKDSGRYGYSGNNAWEETRFVREVNIKTIPDGDDENDREAKIEVRVVWQMANFPIREVVVREYIYDW